MSADIPILPRGFRMLSITLLVLGWACEARADDADRIRRAIAYLDGRQEDWAAFAKAQRGEGTNRTTCVSCHTGISYAFARPALGRFMAIANPAAAEERMITQVSQRVAHWAELDEPRFRLMYDGSDRKKAEARGTEAVLNALILARNDATQGRSAPGDTTQTALKHLWTTQTTSGSDAGSWDWLNFGLNPWESDDSRPFGAALAAIAVSTAPGYMNHLPDEAAARGLGLLRDYLRQQFPEESLFNRLVILEASRSWKDLLPADQQKTVVDQLLAAQRPDGGWSLATFGDFERVDGTAQIHESDGYATGLAIHTLRCSGGTAARPEAAKGLDWLRTHQQAEGSWPGRSVNKERDPSTFVGKLMTDAATAFSALALVEAEAR